MGFKDDVRAKAGEFESDIAALKGRVSTLETLAAELKRNGVRGYTAPVTASALPTRTPGGSYDAVTGSSRPSATTTTSDVDYGAVAFGLSEIKRKVADLLGASRGLGALQSEYPSTVQYFADVFAKADPSFDADAFKRQAGV